MKPKDDIKRNWRDCFNDTPEYIDMYFNRVYSDMDAIYKEENNKIVSSLLLQPYKLMFNGTAVNVGYIAGACTLRAYRGKGHMGDLVKKALRESALRGDLFTFLIPAHEWLYYYYDKFGFITAVFADVERYTALHSFPTTESYSDADRDLDRLYTAFSEIELTTEGSILHSRRDFENIMLDNTLDGGHAIALKRDDAICAIAFAVEIDNMVEVKQILSTDEEARQAALARLRAIYPGLPFKVVMPINEHRKPIPRGMARIVDVESVVKTLARSNPNWRCRIRITDPILEFNNTTWRIGGGEAVLLDDTGYQGKLDYDVDVTTLTAMLLSSKKTGGILNVPTTRVNLSLMLD